MSIFVIKLVLTLPKVSMNLACKRWYTDTLISLKMGPACDRATFLSHNGLSAGMAGLIPCILLGSTHILFTNMHTYTHWWPDQFLDKCHLLHNGIYAWNSHISAKVTFLVGCHSNSNTNRQNVAFIFTVRGMMPFNMMPIIYTFY